METRQQEELCALKHINSTMSSTSTTFGISTQSQYLPTSITNTMSVSSTSISGQIIQPSIQPTPLRQARPPTIQQQALQHSGNSSPTSSDNANNNNANNKNNTKFFNDEYLFRLIHDFTNQQSSNQTNTLPPQPITLNQIKEEQAKKRVSSTPPVVNNGVLSVVNCSSPSSIRRSASLTNAVAYGAVSGATIAPHIAPPTQTYAVASNNGVWMNNIGQQVHGSIVSAHAGLTHSVSASQLRNQNQHFYPSNTISSPVHSSGANYSSISGHYVPSTISQNRTAPGTVVPVVGVNTTTVSHSNPPTS